MEFNAKNLDSPEKQTNKENSKNSCWKNTKIAQKSEGKKIFSSSSSLMLYV